MEEVKREVPGRASDLVMRVIGLAALAAVTVFVLVTWKRIPDVVPGHFNFRGQIDGYAAKKMIFFPLVMGWGIFAMIQLISALPQAWNTGVELTAENAARILRGLKTMLLFLGMVIALFLSYMTFIMATGRSMSPAALPIFLAVAVAAPLVILTRSFIKR